MTAEDPRPLAGCRIVVTRARAQAGDLRRLLEAEGAEVIEFPVIRVSPPADFGPADRAIRRLGAYEWIVFTSRNGVAAFLDRVHAVAGDAAAGPLGLARIAAIGPGTAEALAARGLAVALAPSEFRAEALVAAFAGEDLRGRRVLVPRAADARSVLPDGLRALGASVDVVPVYRTEPEQGPPPEVRRLLERGEVDAVTFTSSSTVRHFVALLGPTARPALRRVLVACIGPVTAGTVREQGLHPGAVAETYTIPGLVAALRAALPERRAQRTWGRRPSGRGEEATG